MEIGTRQVWSREEKMARLDRQAAWLAKVRAGHSQEGEVLDLAR